jgi:hypothetical protein
MRKAENLQKLTYIFFNGNTEKVIVNPSLSNHPPQARKWRKTIEAILFYGPMGEDNEIVIW